MANAESPNTLLSTAQIKILDLLGDGPHYRFRLKSGIYGNDPLCSTYFDDVPVRNLDGSYNYNISGAGFTFDYLLGTSTQTGLTGFQKVESIIPLTANTRVANPPVGAGPWKPVIASFNTNTYPDADTVKVTMRVPAMFAQDDNGNTHPFSVFYETDISVNNGDWVPQIIGVDGNGDPSTVAEIRGKCTSTYQRTHVFVLPKTTPPASYYEWKVRVRRTSVNILSIKTQNELFVDSMSVVSSNLFAYPNSVVVGMTLSADQFASVPARSYEMEGLMVPLFSGYQPTQYPVTGGIIPAVYPDVWYGNYTGVGWTDNPALIFNDLLTNPVHGLGDYIPSGAVDKWSLYEIAQYCDQLVDDGAGGVEPNFTCNVQIQQPDDAYSVLLNLASTFRGMLYYANGTIHATQTSNKTPFTVFTNANAIGGQFSYADTSQATRSTVAIVKWIDPQNGYRQNVEYIEDLDGIQRYGYQEKQMTAFACTSKGQAYRLGRWTLETERLLTETITFQTDMEGMSLKPGEAFGVYDNFRNNQQQGGRIIGMSSGRSLITLDRNVTIDPALVYSLTAIVPKFTLDGTGDLTGSNQIPLINNPQIETFQVVTPPNLTTNQLLVSGSYSSDIFIGTPWVLSASGTPNVFDSATFYTCLATAEIEPGKIEVLGLQANTGINFVIATGYTTETYPVNPGDSSAISPPSAFAVAEVSGTSADGTFYDVLRTSWSNSSSPNLSYYILSGKTFNEPYSAQTVIGTSFDWPRTSTGQYLFRLAAVSLGGVQSSFVTGGINILLENPLGTLRRLSGIQIIEDFDPLYFTTTGYTGYVGTTPTFEWNVLTDSNGNPIVDNQFISGYRLSFKSFNGLTDYVTPFTVSGRENTTYEVPSGLIYSFVGGPQRGFDFKVETVDIYGNIAPGASLPVNNPVMKPPFSSGFVGYNGGVSYSVTPSLQYDTSGIYMWVNTSPSFTPTYDNFSYTSSNLAGVANVVSQTGTFWTWFALTDTFGRTGNPIFGPVSGNSNGVIASFSYDISNQINAAFNLLSGNITILSGFTTGSDYQLGLLINGLSGQVTGLPGVVNTALNVRVQTVVVSSSGALSSTIDAVSARVELTGRQNMTITAATGAQLLQSIATTGGALSQWIINLSASTTGANARINIGATAFVTGDGVTYPWTAIATWGVELNANGKASFLRATSANTYGMPATNSVLALGSMDIQSDTFTAGSAGWRIRYDGSAEFSNAIVRGTFTGGAGASLVSMNQVGLTVGDPVGDRLQMQSTLSNHLFATYNSSNAQTATLGNLDIGGGVVGGALFLNTSAGSPTISLNGGNGNINCDILDVDTTSNFDGAATFQGQVNITSTNKLHFSAAGTNNAYIAEDFGMNLWGTATQPTHVRGGSLVRGGTAGGNFGTQNILNFTIDFNPDTSWSDGVLPNTFECATVGGADSVFAAYLKLRGPGGTTIYVPYRTTAP